MKTRQIVGLLIIAFGIYRLTRGPQTIEGVVAEVDRRAPYWLVGLGAAIFLVAP